MNNVTNIHVPIRHVYNNIIHTEVPNLRCQLVEGGKPCKPLIWKLVFVMDAGSPEENSRISPYTIVEDPLEIMKKIKNAGYLVEVKTVSEV